MNTPNRNRAVIEVTEDSRWFLERYLSVFDFLEMFPPDAISTGTGAGVPVTFVTDLGFEFASDIDGSKMQLRNRSRHKGWMKWIEHHGLNLGDRIVIERTGERTFALRLEPKQGDSD